MRGWFCVYRLYSEEKVWIVATAYFNASYDYYSRRRWSFPYVGLTAYSCNIGEMCFLCRSKKAGKVGLLQAWTGPEGSTNLRLPDFMTMTQDAGKVSLTHRPPLPPGNIPVLISVRGWVDPRAIVRSEGIYVNEKSTDTSWDRTSDDVVSTFLKFLLR